MSKLGREFCQEENGKLVLRENTAKVLIKQIRQPALLSDLSQFTVSAAFLKDETGGISLTFAFQTKFPQLEGEFMPQKLPEMKFQTNYPLLAYTSPEPRHPRIFLVNLVKNEPQICIDLRNRNLEFLDFMETGAFQLNLKQGMAIKDLHILVRSITSR